MTVCRGVKQGLHGLTVYGITNQLRLSALPCDCVPAAEAAVTPGVFVFLGDDGPKKSVPFVLTVAAPWKRDSFHVDKTRQQTTDTRVMSVVLKVRDSGVS